MAKDKIADYDGATAGNNTDIGGISIDEGMLPSTVNNSMRELTRQLGAFADGTDGIDVLNLQDDDASASIKIQAPATVTTTTTFTLPDGDGTSGYALVTNGSGQLSWASAAGIGNLVEDTSPQLGGNLDTNGNDINFGDNDEAIFGAGTDLRIYHNASNGNSHITESGSGSLVINGDNLYLQNTAGTENYIAAISNDAVTLYHDNAAKLATTSSGVDITGAFTATAASTITTTGNEVQLTLKSTDADAVEGPTLDLIRDSASPAASDNIGLIRYIGEDSAGNATVYAEIHGQIENPANGSEDAALNFEITKGSGRANSFKIAADEVVVNDASRDVDFRVESDNTTHALFVEGSSGNVGIGTASVDNKLHLENAGSLYLQIENTSTANKFYVGNSSGSAILESTGSYSMNFKTNSTERMRLTSDGKIGIGTSSPTQEIHGYSSGGDFSLKLESASATGTAYTMYKNADQEYAVGLRGSASDTFQIIDFTADATRLSVDTSGNVGIGTSSPNEKLTIDSGALSFLGSLSTPSIGAGIFRPANNSLAFVTGGSQRAMFDDSANFLVGASSLNDTNGFTVFPTGSGSATMVRIDRSSNGSALQFRQGQSAIGTVSTTTSGVTYNTTSDIRLKTDIEPIDHATDMLMAMNPVSHRWKADPDADAVVGFIAQQMQEIVPEAVSTGDDDDAMMSMDYGRITPVIVAALQDAHRKIEQLEQRIADMEAN